MHSSSEKPQGLQGILWNLSLFRKERQHTNPSKGDLNVTLHWPLWELRDLFSLWVLRREQAGAGLQLCILPPGDAEGRFLNILTKARMSRLPEQWKCRLLSYLFFRTDAGRPQAGTASLYTDSFITWQTAAPTKIYMKQKSLFVFAKLYFTFCIWLWFDSWSACRVVSRAEGLTRQMFNRGSSKR